RALRAALRRHRPVQGRDRAHLPPEWRAHLPWPQPGGGGKRRDRDLLRSGARARIGVGGIGAALALIHLRAGQWGRGAVPPLPVALSARPALPGALAAPLPAASR